MKKVCFLFFVLFSMESFPQKISTYIGVSSGVNFNTKSTFFPYINNGDSFNETGKILWEGNHPSMNVGLNLNRIRKRGLVWSANINFSTINHRFSIENNTLVFSPIFIAVYMAREFEYASYSALFISTNFAMGWNLLHRREFSLSVLGGPIIQNIFNKNFQHYAGFEFGPERNFRLENYIGTQQIRSVMFGLSIFPQAIIRLKKSLHMICSVSFSYYFNAMVQYNQEFDTMYSSPFRKNDALRLGLGGSIGIAYKL